MKPEEKLQAIQALINGEYDNEYLIQIGELWPNLETNIQMILKY